MYTGPQFIRFKESRKNYGKSGNLQNIANIRRTVLICILQGHYKAAVKLGVAQATHSSKVADPGFPRCGGTNPPGGRGGGTTYNYAKFSKNCTELKELGGRGEGEWREQASKILLCRFATGVFAVWVRLAFLNYSILTKFICNNIDSNLPPLRCNWSGTDLK